MLGLSSGVGTYVGGASHDYSGADRRPGRPRADTFFSFLARDPQPLSLTSIFNTRPATTLNLPEPVRTDTMRPIELPFLDRMLRRIRPSLKPIKFPTTGFETVSKDVVLEEESLYDFEENAFFPVQIGDILDKKYQVLGKLGWGVTATVWLVRDLT